MKHGNCCNAEAIAKIFHVNKYTVYHLEERKRKTGVEVGKLC